MGIGQIKFQYTLLQGNVDIKSGIHPDSKLANSTINVDWFGLDNTGVSDNSSRLVDILRLIFKGEAFRREITHTINFGVGTYLFNSAILDPSFAYAWGHYIKFIGVSPESTFINFMGADVLFNNDNLIGFSLFENIAFVGNNTNTFMRTNGGSGGWVQSITYNRCYWRNFKTVMDVQKNTAEVMGSEMTFQLCKVYSSDNNSELFIMNNSQATNWRFYSTDIEDVGGIVFRVLRSTKVAMYSCSIIPQGEEVQPKFIQMEGVDTNADFNLYSCKLELRDSSALIDASQATGFVGDFIFNACGLGSFNIDDVTYPERYQILTPASTIRMGFNDCNALYNLRVLDAPNESSFSRRNNRIIYLNNCADLLRGIYSVTELNNDAGYIRYVVDGVNINGINIGGNVTNNYADRNTPYQTQPNVVDFEKVAVLDVGASTVFYEKTLDYVGKIAFNINMYEGWHIDIYVDGADTPTLTIQGSAKAGNTRWIKTIDVNAFDVKIVIVNDGTFRAALGGSITLLKDCSVHSITDDMGAFVGDFRFTGGKPSWWTGTKWVDATGADV